MCAKIDCATEKITFSREKKKPTPHIRETDQINNFLHFHDGNFSLSIIITFRRYFGGTTAQPAHGSAVSAECLLRAPNLDPQRSPSRLTKTICTRLLHNIGSYHLSASADYHLGQLLNQRRAELATGRHDSHSAADYHKWKSFSRDFPTSQVLTSMNHHH